MLNFAFSNIMTLGILKERCTYIDSSGCHHRFTYMMGEEHAILMETQTV